MKNNHEKIQPLRIPYMGSKAKIANQLMRKMLSVVPKAKYFVDLFGGGGAMSFCALQHGLEVIYNEKQTSLAEFLQYIVDRTKSGQRSCFGLFPEEWYNFVSREEFIKQKDLQTPYSQCVRICYSFGNNQRNYAFNRDIELNKKLGHNIVMFQCLNSLKEFNECNEVHFTISNAKTWNERRLNFRNQCNEHIKQNPVVIDMIKKGIVRNPTQIVPRTKAIWLKNDSVEQLEQLQRLERLERLEPFTILNLDYKNVPIHTPIEETIVYLDPPYRGTGKYLEKDTIHAEIDEYFRCSPYICFMSEYNAPFEPIMIIEKMQTLQNNVLTQDNSVRQERLYINKPMQVGCDFIPLLRQVNNTNIKHTKELYVTSDLFY